MTTTQTKTIGYRIAYKSHWATRPYVRDYYIEDESEPYYWSAEHDATQFPPRYWLTRAAALAHIADLEERPLCRGETGPTTDYRPIRTSARIANRIASGYLK